MASRKKGLMWKMSKFVWVSVILQKIKTFVWQLSWGKIKTADKLVEHGLDISPRCNFCTTGMESLDHLMLQCTAAKRIWYNILDMFKLTGPVNACFDIFWKWCANQCRESQAKRISWIIFCQCTVWGIWMERNERRFKNTRKPQKLIQADIERRAREFLAITGRLKTRPFCDAHILHNFHIPSLVPQDKEPILLYWTLPEEFIKLNFDGVARGRNGVSGGVLRNWEGKFIAGFSKHLGKGTNHRAELLAAIEVLQLALQMGITKLLVEGDSRLVVNLITNQWLPGWKLHTLTENARHLLNFFEEVKEFPSKIFFFCSEPSPEGGETSIIPSHIIVEKMEESVPSFVSKLEEDGYIYRFKTAKEDDSSESISKTWKFLFQTEDQDEAEKRAKIKTGCTSINFLDDGSAEMLFGPINPITKFGERRVWFNTILRYKSNEKDAVIGFGDGSHFPADAIDAYKRILNGNCVDLSWQKGDVLLVDNLAVQHARRPGKPPRVILVSICK